MKLERDLLRQIINLLAIVAAFGTNVAANLAPIKGVQSKVVGHLKERSPKYQTKPSSLILEKRIFI